MALHTPSFCQGSLTLLSSEEKGFRINAWKQAADQVLDIGGRFFKKVETTGPPVMAPLVPDSIFQSAVVYGYLWRETGETGYHDAVLYMKKALEIFAKRWGVAGMYNVLQFLECFD